MRYELPESELLIHVAYRREDGVLIPLSSLNPSPLGWTELPDGSLVRRQHFGGGPGLPRYEVTAHLRGNGLVEIDAPGLVLDERRGGDSGTVRIRGSDLPVCSLFFLPDPEPAS